MIAPSASACVCLPDSHRYAADQRLTRIAALLAMLLIGVASAGYVWSSGPAAARFSGVEKIVVFGDVHGAAGTLVELLTNLELIDGQRAWTAGATHLVSLEDIARQAREEVPRHPLRVFCKQAGAKYCYDVDWTQLVGKIQGEPEVFLSRPLDVFLRETILPRDTVERLFEAGFGRPPVLGARIRMFSINDGLNLMAEVRPGGVELRWRADEASVWNGQSFGEGEGGKVPPAAWRK